MPITISVCCFSKLPLLGTLCNHQKKKDSAERKGLY